MCRSPLVAAKVVLDEIFFVTEVLSRARDGQPDRDPSCQTEIAMPSVSSTPRAWLLRSDALFQKPRHSEPRAISDASSFGRPYRHLTIASEYEPHPGEPGGERWHARTANRHPATSLGCAAIPDRAPLARVPSTAIARVAAHGPASVQAPRWLHETLGVNLALPVLPLHGPRSSGWRSGEGMFSGEVLDLVHLKAQAIWDLRRLLAWLRMRDGMPAGLYGLSLGGGIAALTAAVEPDLACVIAGMPMVDVMGLVERHVPPFVRDLAERMGISFDDIGRLLRMGVAALDAAARRPERLFIFGGVADRLVPSHQVRALWKHWGEPRIEWHGGSHTSFGIESKVGLLVSEALQRTRLTAA
jgi:hypothetical protein